MTRRALAAVAAVSTLAGLALGATHAPTSTASYTSRSSHHQTVTTAAVFPSTGPVADGVSVQALNAAPDASQQISMTVQVTNTGTAPLPLNEVSLRYWFTNDTGSGDLGVRCTFVGGARLSCGDLTTSIDIVDPTRIGGDRAMVVGLGGDVLAPGRSTGAAQLQIYRDGSNDPFDQRDDHSRITSTALADAPTITAYRNGRLVWGVEPAQQPARPELRVKHADLGSSPTDNAINPGLVLVNSGTVGVDLRRVTVRYWFTRDGGSTSFQTWLDYAPPGIPKPELGTSSLVPARKGADTTLDIGFAGGKIPADSSTGPWQLRLSKTDWSSFDERDDHSYRVGATYAPAPAVTVYLDGQLVWGTEPS